MITCQILTQVSLNHKIALMKACEKGYLGIAKFLIERGANMELHSNDGCCALIRAANYGHFEILKIMVEHKANLNIVSKNGNVRITITKNHIQLILFIIYYFRSLH